MFITKLDVVNDCLATMGETPLNNLVEDHSYKAAALAALDKAVKDLAAKNLWFNTELAELQQQADTGYIYVPADVVRIRTVAESGAWSVVQRGNRLYDLSNNTYVFTGGVTTQISRLIEFEELPYQGANWAARRAVLKFQGNFDADAMRNRDLTQEYMLATAELTSENVRQRRPNLLARRSVLRLLFTPTLPMPGQPFHPHMTG